MMNNRIPPRQDNEDTYLRRKPDNSYSIPKIDFDDLGQKASNIRQSVNPFWTIFTACIGSFFTFLAALIGSIIGINPLNIYTTKAIIFLILTIVSFVLIFVFLYLAINSKNNFNYDIKSLTSEFKKIEKKFYPPKEIKEINEVSTTTKKKPIKFTYNKQWIANCKKEVLQGVDYKRVENNNKFIKEISFNLISISNYWRAGLKLSGNNPLMPLLVTPGSFLFHTGIDKNNIIFYAYENGHTTPKIRKHFDSYDIKKIKFRLTAAPIDSFTIKINIFINDKLEYEGSIPNELLLRIYLLAWGDKHIYSVEFDKINVIFD